MAQNEESLQKSREERFKFITEFGFVPNSIMQHDRQDRSLDLQVNKRSYANSSRYLKKGLDPLSKGLMQSTGFELSGRSCRDGALSRFPQNIGRFMVKFYCPENGLVYDPFAGHNSRMQLVYETGRNYVATDICKKFMETNRGIRNMLLKDGKKGFFKNNSFITLYEQSSSDVPQLEDASADYTSTSPPYWNVEYYGDETEQLGNAKTFDKFMKLLEEHIKENFRILKPGAYCTWFVNDFVKDKTFYCYHAELIKVFQRVGFTLHDIVIVDLGQPIVAAFIETIKKTMRSAKRHEYAITFKKE